MARSRFIRLLGLLVVGVGFAFLIWTRGTGEQRAQNNLCPTTEPQRVVAHAGGMMADGETYTNSLEALNFNYEQGHRVFEVDISWTADDQLVVLHDWKQAAERVFGQAKQLTMAEFVDQRRTAAYTVLTLEELLDWVEQHSEIMIVTDIKGDYVKALAAISQRENIQQQILAQIYGFEEYERVRNLGYCQIILSLYQKEFSIDRLLSFTAANELYAITMNTERAYEAVGQRLDLTDTFTYVHTVNEPSEFERFRELGIDGLYTDQNDLTIFGD